MHVPKHDKETHFNICKKNLLKNPGDAQMTCMPMWFEQWCSNNIYQVYAHSTLLFGIYLRTVKHGIKVSVLNPTRPFHTCVMKSPLNLPSGHIQALNYSVWRQTTVAQYHQTSSESRKHVLWQSFIPNRTHTRNQLNHFSFLPIIHVPTALIANTATNPHINGLAVKFLAVETATVFVIIPRFAECFKIYSFLIFLYSSLSSS